ncbi:hypothetical protein RRG08_032978 [Elysia crispata]|uniref:Uncharacterized protein n=1 Tax=Elysia crispata TaxID=231223 RepID=A0AAE0YSD4_9GAST|nr:hypothetical protein RRG08_032978 [Elysia crispata]
MARSGLRERGDQLWEVEKVVTLPTTDPASSKPGNCSPPVSSAHNIRGDTSGWRQLAAIVVDDLPNDGAGGTTPQ